MSEPMPREERKRLASQLERVEEFVLRPWAWDGGNYWLTLQSISKACGCSEASASARLRDLRKKGYKVERMKSILNDNLYLYRVTKPIPKQLNLLQDNQDGHP